jgi:hypothetical protein
MWLSADPAMGEYIPQAPINDEARKRNQNLPGMGGVYNYINLHTYHYAGNNPVKLSDPDGRDTIWNIDETNKTIEITLPIRFADDTTINQRQMFYEAARNWEGAYGDTTNGVYTVSMRIVEVYGTDKYNGVNVNTVTFSSLQRNDNATPPLIPNVINNRNMTIYSDNSSRKGYIQLLTHEIGHLMGMRDKYLELKDVNGKRHTPPMNGWENNIMANTYSGYVGARNIFEAIGRRVNKKIISK